MQQYSKDQDDDVFECEGRFVAFLRNMYVKDRLPDDLRGCGDILGMNVGKKMGICTRKNTNKDETNDDGDYSDRRHRGVN